MVDGYLCIKNEKIKHILSSKEDGTIKKLEKYPTKYTFKNKVVMAAAIDTNISLSCGLDGWDYTREFTRFDFYTWI